MAIVAFALVVIVWRPRRLDLDNSCRPASSVNVIRSKVLPGRYWKSQLALLDQVVRALDGIPRERVWLDSFDIAARKEDSVYYAAHPDEHERFVPKRYARDSGIGRETVPERAAAFLDSADAIELANDRAFFDSVNRVRRIQLSACRDSILRKAQR